MKKEALLPKLKRMIRSHIELKLSFFCGSDALSRFFLVGADRHAAFKIVPKFRRRFLDTLY